MMKTRATPLDAQLDRLATFEPTSFPVLSLYLNTQADQHGQDNFETFTRKEFTARAKSYAAHSPERKSFDRDVERIQEYLREQLHPSTNGLAVFTCAGANDFFEAVQLNAPINEHRLYVYRNPHLYPLARLNDQYRRYAALIVDTNSARLFVFGLGTSLEKEHVNNANVNRTSVGGWSQARYQRHIDNYYLHHAKEVVEALDRAVREDNIQQILIAGDEVILPKLREQLPRHLADRVSEVGRLDMKTPEHEVLRVTLEAMKEQDAKEDKEKVERMLDAYRAGGLAVIGVQETLAALTNGRVDELLISSSRKEIREEADAGTAPPENETPPNNPGRSQTRKVETGEALVLLARQTGAHVTFVEDPALLADVGGVGATLRYRI